MTKFNSFKSYETYITDFKKEYDEIYGVIDILNVDESYKRKLKKAMSFINRRMIKIQKAKYHDLHEHIRLKRWNSGKIHNDVENYITIKEDKRYK
jgi:hypothetical protein